jgi:hypothetical protein
MKKHKKITNEILISDGFGFKSLFICDLEFKTQK